MDMRRRPIAASIVRVLSLFGLAAIFIAGGATFAGTPVQKTDRGAKAEVEGTVTNLTGVCPSVSFTVGETRVLVSEQTRFEDGTCQDLADDRRVEVKGKLSADGTLTAWKVDLDE